MALLPLQDGFEGNRMQSFVPGLFDRLDTDDDAPQGEFRASSRKVDAWRDSITRDLEALLNTRSALLPHVLAQYPEVGGSVVNYGLIDFAGMCMTSDTDQKRICTAVRLAIERHESRLHRVTATLQPRKGAINRVDFVITAELKNAPVAEPMHFNAVFQPSLQRYSVQSVRGAP
ncbi:MULTISPECIES: type VI secretion system baseplate subunit TssE [unclassified Massilia]|uniref:type VI secretion system baseplate subunit TssE n=1 Tax=unclassified Massilia TaxID=2609279 RepID=UPI000AE26833|nr:MULTISPECIES: type VI secretion system baseplate subunit TssE [unclassified Massilia]